MIDYSLIMNPFMVIMVFAVFAASWASCLFLERLLKKYHIFDHPNARSNHQNPTPRGGGIAVMAAWMIGACILNIYTALFPFNFIWLFSGLIAVMVVSWIDDLRHVPAITRLCVHTLAVLISLPSLPGLLWDGFPLWLNITLISLFWIWFMNLYNFMDGIDGISGVETLSICTGIVLIAWLVPSITTLEVPLLLLGAATAGFLIRNWSPARIFLGDVGSISIGFILGWALLWLAISGPVIAALILPLYYLADSGLTLLRRLIRGEAFWKAHSEHAFQHAVRRGMSHAQVSQRILLTNIVLIAFAVTSLNPELTVISLIGAILGVTLLLCDLSDDSPSSASKQSFSR